MATIQGIYLALFGRPADPAGLSYFNGVTKDGADLSAIGDLAGQKEYTDRFQGMTTSQIVNSIYKSLFGRDAELDGVTFWTGKLASGAFSINNVAIAILDGAQGSDRAIIDAKLAAANLFTSHLDLPNEQQAYGASAQNIGLARDYIATINQSRAGTAPEVDEIIAQMLKNAGQEPLDSGSPDVTPPSAPALFFTGPDKGGTVHFSGTAEAGSTVSIVSGGTKLGSVVADGKGTFVLDVKVDLTSPIDLSATATATDPSGNQSLSSKTVKFLDVDDENPVIATSMASSILENTQIVGTVTITDDDATGAPTVTLTGADATLFEIVGGNLQFIAAPDFESKTHGADYFVEIVAKGKADPSQTSSSGLLKVIVQDVYEVPVAVDDTAKTTTSNSVIIDARTNDFVNAGYTLSIDGSPSAANGTVLVNKDGTLTYTPDAGFVGTDTISYSVTDGKNASSATVAVTVSSEVFVLAKGASPAIASGGLGPMFVSSFDAGVDKFDLSDLPLPTQVTQSAFVGTEAWVLNFLATRPANLPFLGGGEKGLVVYFPTTDGRVVIVADTNNNGTFQLSGPDADAVVVITGTSISMNDFIA